MGAQKTWGLLAWERGLAKPKVRLRAEEAEMAMAGLFLGGVAGLFVGAFIVAGLTVTIGVWSLVPGFMAGVTGCVIGWKQVKADIVRTNPDYR